MKTERRRAIITISATLIIGIVIGTLTSGLWSRKYYSGRNSRGKTEMRNDFERRMLKAVEADEQQVKALQPIMKETMAHIDSLQQKTDTEVRVLLDTLDVRFKSILTADQYQKFKKHVGSRGHKSDRDHGHRNHQK